MRGVVRGLILGAVIGAVVGLLAGLLVHAIAQSNSSLVTFEIVAGLLGLVFGTGLGAFYGGALRLPQDSSDD